MVSVRRYDIFDFDSEIFNGATPYGYWTNWLLVRRYEIFDFDSEIFNGDTPYGYWTNCNITWESQFLLWETGILAFLF